MRKALILSGIAVCAMLSASLPAGAVLATESRAESASTEQLAPPPPATWQEHWFEHNQVIKRVAYNDTVAVYFDDDVNPAAANWITPYLTKLWQYVLKTYGNSGNLLGSDRLYSIHHEGKYYGGHPATVYDQSHDFRNVSDVGGDNWASPQYEVVTHETGHVVEIIGAGHHGSPAFPLWRDSKWLELYIYDVYVALGMTAEAQQFYNRMQTNRDDFPRANTYWFRDWFYPLWRDHGGAQVMAKFFQLLGQHFPTRPDGNHRDFTRDMNYGEFVHFMSGAASTNLKPLATKAFGWPASWEQQFKKAQADFPGIKY
jgi:hypothetical protein